MRSDSEMNMSAYADQNHASISRAFGLNLFTLFHNDILGNEHLFTKVFLFYHKNGNPARRIPIFKNVLDILATRCTSCNA